MIWCVEDDASIRDIEVYALQSTGFEAKGFEDGTSFWEALRTIFCNSSLEESTNSATAKSSGATS